MKFLAHLFKFPNVVVSMDPCHFIIFHLMTAPHKETFGSVSDLSKSILFSGFLSAMSISLKVLNFKDNLPLVDEQ